MPCPGSASPATTTARRMVPARRNPSTISSALSTPAEPLATSNENVPWPVAVRVLGVGAHVLLDQRRQRRLTQHPVVEEAGVHQQVHVGGLDRGRGQRVPNGLVGELEPL